MNIASIDIGSNTVLLLIAKVKENNLKPIVNKYESPRLGKNLQIGSNILDERIDHLISILTEFKIIIEKNNCKKIIISATNAMRISSNSNDIIELVKEKLDLNIEIISGDEEAKRSFLGASSSLPNLDKKVVIDIGGGSTEIIYGDNEKIMFKKSFQTGVVSLTEKYLSKFPYKKESFNKINEHFETIFAELNEAIPKNIPTIAVAGTPTTLSCINQNIKIYKEDKVEKSVLMLNDINRLYNDLSKINGLQIKGKYGEVVHGREDVLFSGLLILQHIMKEILVDRVNVSSRGLRYGNIINYLNNIK